jgi:uncharacterized membrane protein (DUF485 family)
MKATSKIRLISVIAVLLVVFGFRFVAQVGQGLNTPQNDGYGVAGGIMLVLAGLIVGYIIGKGYVFNRTPKRKDINKASETNLAELSRFAGDIKAKKD